MKKVLSVCLCLVLCAALLCGCPRTPPDTSDPSSGTTPTTKPTTTPEDDDRPVKDLPQADEHTIRWTLDFPDDLKVSTYQTPQLVAPEDFDWGEYMLFVQFEGGGFVKDDGYFNRAFLGKDVSDLQQGQQLYQAFNDLYKTVYPPVSGTFEYDSYVLPDKEDLRKFLFESSVVSVSPDLKRVETFSHVYKGNTSGETTLDLFWEKWATEYKIYQDGQLDFSYQSPTANDFYDAADLYGPYYYQTNRFQDPVRYSGYPDWNNGKYLINRIRDDEKRQELYCIYSLEENRMLYQVTEAFDLSCEIDGHTVFASPNHFVVNDRYLLVDFWSTNEPENSPYYIHSVTSYLFDLQTGTWQHLEDFANYVVFSPDGKYMAYTNWMSENTLPEQPEGFYIKNLENGTTTYYPFEIKSGLVDRLPLAPLGFVHYDTLMQTIGHQR